MSRNWRGRLKRFGRKEDGLLVRFLSRIRLHSIIHRRDVKTAAASLAQSGSVAKHHLICSVDKIQDLLYQRPLLRRPSKQRQEVSFVQRATTYSDSAHYQHRREHGSVSRSESDNCDVFGGTGESDQLSERGDRL